ncbi:protein-tyrosine phosphatase family protein [Pseudoduganella sp. R-32]|uniref:phosphatase domain-containing putative toxin n=1 Tax=Pseudoduganella sp. R-32 TaxID=3404061 RepID=UPI003CE71C1D
MTRQIDANRSSIRGAINRGSAETSLDIAEREFIELKNMARRPELNSKVVGGFNDISISDRCLEDSKGRKFNGHEVGNSTIICGAPQNNRPESMLQFADVLTGQKVEWIIDLSQIKDMLHSAYTPKKPMTFGTQDQSATFHLTDPQRGIRGIADSAAQTGLLEVSVGGKQHAINYVNIPIEDFQAPTVEQLHEIAAMVNKIQDKLNASDSGEKLVIHCTAGVGRSGTAITAANLRRSRQEGKLTSANWLDVLKEHIVDLREQRSDMMVQSLAQYSRLRDYAKDLAHGLYDASIGSTGRVRQNSAVQLIAQKQSRPQVPPRPSPQALSELASKVAAEQQTTPPVAQNRQPSAPAVPDQRGPSTSNAQSGRPKERPEVPVRPLHLTQGSQSTPPSTSRNAGEESRPPPSVLQSQKPAQARVTERREIRRGLRNGFKEQNTFSYRMLNTLFGGLGNGEQNRVLAKLTADKGTIRELTSDFNAKENQRRVDLVRSYGIGTVSKTEKAQPSRNSDATTHSQPSAPRPPQFPDVSDPARLKKEIARLQNKTTSLSYRFRDTFLGGIGNRSTKRKLDALLEKQGAINRARTAREAEAADMSLQRVRSARIG